MRAVPHQRLAALTVRLHPALRQHLRSSDTSRSRQGTISVIVPCYNVEAYLPGCLNSIIRQSYSDLEIIVVIDGSPDRSAQIARSYARWDRRVTVIEQPNAGLGAARNTGIRRATGQWIAFADSDDTLPAHAYRTMVESLAETGSDFAVGNIERRKGSNRFIPAWAKDVHRRTRSATNLDEFPQILADVFSWNKLFRRDFFDRVVTSFPEGIRYEDQEPMAKAYAAARSFDVLHQVVYTWYVRDDGSSITQQKSSILDLTDRLTVMGHVNEVLTRWANPHVVERWQSKSVGLDLRAYYNEVPRTGPEYWNALVSGVRDVTKDMDEAAWAGVNVQDRLLARLVEDDQRDDVCVALRHRSESGDGALLDLLATPTVIRPLYLDELRFRPTPADLRPGPTDDRMTVTLLGYRLCGPDIEVSGMAQVPGVDVGHFESSLTAFFLDEHDRVQTPPLRLTRFSDATLDELANNSAASQAASGFRIRINRAALCEWISQEVPAMDDDPLLHPGWALELTLEIAGRVWSSPVTSWDKRWTANRLDVSELVDGIRLVPIFTNGRGLHFHLYRPRVIATAVTVRDRELTVSAVERDGAPITHISASCSVFGLTRQASTSMVDGQFSATLQLPPLPLGARPRKSFVWGIRAHVGDQRLPVDFEGSSTDLASDAGERRLRLTTLTTGRLRLLDSKMQASVTKVDVAADARAFTVHGQAEPPLGQPFALALVSDHGLWQPDSMQHDPHTSSFTATFTVTTSLFGHEVARPTAGWSLRLLASADTPAGSLWISVGPAAVIDVSPHFLHWTKGERLAFRFTVTTEARALWVNTRSVLDETEMVQIGQKRLWDGIPALLRSPLHDAVLFSTFGGRSAGDSPLAIHDELRSRGCPSRLIWEVADGLAVTPEGTETVVIGSAEHVKLLHTSSHLVNNNNFPFWYRKRPDQFYLQTWHGTPLKRIGKHVPMTNLSLSYRDLMSREPQAWDVLLAQNDFATEALADAFDYPGEVLNLGYPRNDALTSADDRRRAAVRNRLGVSDNVRLVLYAPTWRDNVKTATGGYALVNHLDLAKVAAAFGGESTLLVRGHSNTPGLTSVPAANILDVSRYPDINDLMIVADVLVTDYSSVMFDYVNTGRPMLFLVPDLAEYAGETRGFYLDFENIAPGPLLSTTEEVLDALASLDRVSTDFVDRYASFKETFAPRDDGSAATRVVDAIWGR
ncbi:CDP-glycerol glycerophosphotransferase family protein [Lapillicoccus sp.]|uniref:bifunctional glycosyltransferase/CDP-glycerol:glycerophosphate glycerophosphotransferase n=1 Tax=Lapillicoccus sp. TaxID=1909287 RepID=UPI00326795FD